jgi:hypothetical protein
MKTLKAGATYFGIVFGIGFILGFVRVLFLVPHFGIRNAELAEMPLMFIAIIFTARWLVQHFDLQDLFERLKVGFIALILLLTLEFSVVLWLQGLTINDYFAKRDPISSMVYFVMLLIFALMPMFMKRNNKKC